MADFYYSGQGIVYVADRATDGTIVKFVDVGNVPVLRLTFETDVVEHKESRTGRRLIDYRLTTENRGRISMTLEVFKKENLQFLFYGDSQSTSGTAVTNESVVITTVANNDIISTKKFPWASVVVKDSATPTPATLVLNTDYSVVDANVGLVKILNIGTYVQPFKFDYTPLVRTVVTVFEQAGKERYIRFAGLNTANSDDKVTVELYRVIFDPAGNFDLINDELAQFELEGSVLFDSTRDTDATLGGFGRVMLSA